MRKQGCGPLLIASVFCALTVWTWRTWPDVLIDFGREVYVPWQLAEGAVLYRDVSYFNGPLSPLLNAALFRCFGVSITTLVVANLVLLAVMSGIIYLYLVRATDRFTATLATLVFLGVFGFGHLTTMGNYNYISPYSHEMTHGVLFSLAMLALLSRWDQRRKTSLVAAGVCFGLVFLGKAELFVGATGGAVAALSLPLAVRRVTLGQVARAAGLFLAGAIIPVLLAIAYLASQMTLSEALLGIAGTWRWVINDGVTGQHFYRQAVAGFDHPWANLASMARAALGVLLVLASAACYVHYRRTSTELERDGTTKSRLSGRPARLLLLAAVVAVTLLVRGYAFPFLLEGKSLLILSFMILAGLIVAAWRRRGDREHFNRLAPLIAWGVLGVLLLAKLALVPRIFHYGFVLGMPACLLLVVALVGLLPAWLGHRWDGAKALRRISAGLLLADLVGYTLVSASSIRNKTFMVGRGGDAMAAYESGKSATGPPIAALLESIERQLPPGATFMALPEGIMLNYLTRRANPIGLTNLMPPELAMYGEDTILDQLAANPPDYVALVHRDTAEYGVGWFGSPEYGAKIMAWVRAHYRPLQTFGAPPLVSDQFGIELMIARRKKKQADSGITPPSG